MSGRPIKYKEKDNKKDFIFIGKYVNTMACQKGKNTNQNQQEKQKELLFSGTLLSKLTEK